MTEHCPLRLRRKAGSSSVFLWSFVGGHARFLAADAEMRIVAPWTGRRREQGFALP